MADSARSSLAALSAELNTRLEATRLTVAAAVRDGSKIPASTVLQWVADLRIIADSISDEVAGEDREV